MVRSPMRYQVVRFILMPSIPSTSGSVIPEAFLG